MGTNAEANDLIDGLDLGNVYTYTIPECDYETTYRWKVVAYNDKGDATTASTWKFTTQPDASVMEFPYTENFDECTKDNPCLRDGSALPTTNTRTADGVPTPSILTVEGCLLLPVDECRTEALR